MRGDPTVLGWATAGAYVLTAALAVLRARAMAGEVGVGEAGQTRFWTVSAVGLFALGVNKQLDLQTDLMAATRVAALGLGLYPDHRVALQYALLAFAVLVVGVLLWLIAAVGRALGPGRRAPLLGWAALALFVVLRAASFHRLDQLGLGFVRWAGVALLELGGIALLAWSALPLRRRTRGPDAR